MIYLDEYVTKYCAKYITELIVLGRKYSFGNLQTSFPNVEEVSLCNCNLDNSITKFNEHFPKIRRLELAWDYLKYTEVDDQTLIVDRFPHLEHLSINIYKPSAIHKSGLREEIVLSIFKLNPNIRSLTVNFCSLG